MRDSIKLVIQQKLNLTERNTRKYSWDSFKNFAQEKNIFNKFLRDYCKVAEGVFHLFKTISKNKIESI